MPEVGAVGAHLGHRAQQRQLDDAVRLGRQRAVQAHVRAAAEESLDARLQRDAERGRGCRVCAWRVRVHLHPERRGDTGDAAGDAAKAKQPEPLAAELVASQLAFEPRARAQPTIGPWQAARRCQQVCQRQLDHRRRRRIRAVEHPAPRFQRSVYVDVVDADASPADDAQPTRAAGANRVGG